MLTYRGTPRLNAAVAVAMTAKPLYDFTAVDGVQHTVWRMEAPAEVSAAFAEVPSLYVADGHHRSAAASRVAKELPGVPGAQHFMAVLFPVEEMRILSYNRVVYRLPEGPEAFLDRIRDRFRLQDPGPKTPTLPGRVALYLRGRGTGSPFPRPRAAPSRTGSTWPASSSTSSGRSSGSRTPGATRTSGS
jgi:uncharacterized protein (DUF1015 family)